MTDHDTGYNQALKDIAKVVDEEAYWDTYWEKNVPITNKHILLDYIRQMQKID